MEQHAALPLQCRLASVQPKTADAAKRTIEMVWSTGAAVPRMDWYSGKRYQEVLSLDPAHVDLSRLNGGAPLLNAHQSYDLAAQIGVVERAWIDGGEARALVRFSDRAEVAPIWADVANGIIRNVSVGYSVRKYEVTAEEGKPEIRKAIDWQPAELSMVPIPADAGASVRSAGGQQPQLYPCEFVRVGATPSAAELAAIDIAQRRLRLIG